MPQSLSKIYVHLVFSTKHRQPTIDDEIKNLLWKYIGCVCKELRCNPVQIGGYYDHIHILCTLSKNIALAKLVEEVKKRSSKWIKTNGVRYNDFYWQDGYGAFSIHTSETETVSNYIKNQEQHHRSYSFQDEFVAILNKYEVEYDERYLWD